MSTNFSKIPKINLNKNLSDGILFQADRSRDGRINMTNLKFDFLNRFAKGRSRYNCEKSTTDFVMSVRLFVHNSTPMVKVFVQFYVEGLQCSLSAHSNLR